MDPTPSLLVEKTILCRDCGVGFIWTPGEQRFFQERGLAAPRRCAACRVAARRARAWAREDGDESPRGAGGR
jgi:hypothetical protein